MEAHVIVSTDNGCFICNAVVPVVEENGSLFFAREAFAALSAACKVEGRASDDWMFQTAKVSIPGYRRATVTLDAGRDYTTVQAYLTGSIPLRRYRAA